MKFHPLADLFPLIEGAEFDELVASIKAHGLREPIILLGDEILDGRNRFRACGVADVEPRFEQFGGDDARQFVIDKNIHRRHLTPSQRGMIGARLATMHVGNPNFSSQTPIVGIPTIAISQDAAASLLGVSRDTVIQAKIVLNEGTEEEIKAVDEGKASASTTAEKIRARNPINRQKGKSVPHTDKVAAKFEQQRINAMLWGTFRDALTGLTSLPTPADVARIARYIDRTGLVDARLDQSLNWLTEFAHEWRQHHSTSSASKRSTNDHADAGNRDEAA